MNGARCRRRVTLDRRRSIRSAQSMDGATAPSEGARSPKPRAAPPGPRLPNISRPVSSRTSLSLRDGDADPREQGGQALAGQPGPGHGPPGRSGAARPNPPTIPGGRGRRPLSVRRDPALPGDSRSLAAPAADPGRRCPRPLKAPTRPAPDAAGARSSPIARRSRLAPRPRWRIGLPEAAGSAPRSPPCPFRDGFSFGRGGRPFSRAISSLRPFSARRTATSSCSRTTCASRLRPAIRGPRSPICLISSRSGSDMNRLNHTTRHVQRTFCTPCPGFCPGYGKCS